MLQLARAGLLPRPLAAPWLRLNGAEDLVRVAENGTTDWVCARTGSLGTFKWLPGEDRWGAFRLSAHKAALAAGLPAQVVRRLMGAMGEIRDNVLEHSQAVESGLLTFLSRPGSFEFSVADCGIGALASLRTNIQYAHLRDEGEALECALSDGESRFGRAAGRGTGFSQLFKSLASLNASLRFRSGDHALTIEGRSPTLVNAHVAKKPLAPGFICTMHCRSAA
jgi:hypothetical protein